MPCSVLIIVGRTGRFFDLPAVQYEQFLQRQHLAHAFGSCKLAKRFHGDDDEDPPIIVQHPEPGAAFGVMYWTGAVGLKRHWSSSYAGLKHAIIVPCWHVYAR